MKTHRPWEPLDNHSDGTTFQIWRDAPKFISQKVDTAINPSPGRRFRQRPRNGE